MSISGASKLEAGEPVLKMEKKSKDPVAAAEAELELKRKQAQELDDELKKKEQELQDKKNQKLELDRAEKLEELEKREQEAEFLISQGRDAGRKALEIRKELEDLGARANTVSEIKEQMIKEGDKAEFASLDRDNGQEVVIEASSKICATNRVISWIMRHLAQVQIAVLAFCLLATWGGFKLYEAKINAYNASLDETEIISEKINPFNDANIQRVFFEKGLEFLDLGLLFIFLLIVAPTVLLYVVPFIKAPNNFSNDFNHDLTPWQRVQCVLFLVFSLLLYFGLKAVVNTF